MCGWPRRRFHLYEGQNRKLKAPAMALEEGGGDDCRRRWRGTHSWRKLGLSGWSLHFLLSVQKQRDDRAVPEAFINVPWKPMCFLSYVFRQETVPTLLGFPALAR